MLNLVLKGNPWMQTFKPAEEGSSGKQTWKFHDADGRETGSYQSEPEVTCEGLRKNSISCETRRVIDKPST